MSTQNKSDLYWMSLAISQARKGLGKTSPNPAVGAVLVRGQRLLAADYHHKAGNPHAEILVLRKVKNPRGATLYVTLEPCCHLEKRTPPCVDALIQSGLKRIVVGALDPNPKVSGKGVRKLRKAGIQVKVGVEQGECEALNPFYYYWMKQRRPWVILKAALSLDGRVALADGRSQWITSEFARRRAHQLRAQVDGVLVGMGSLLQDNPRLNVRLNGKHRQPIRILWDPDLQIPVSAKIILTKQAGPFWIITTAKNSIGAKAKKLKARGVEILACPDASRKKLPVKKLLTVLGRKGIQSLLVEGGPGIWTEFYRQGAVLELCLFLAPKILGGDAKAWMGPLGKRALPSGPEWEWLGMERVGSDLLLRFKKI
jgi:diaminohydroxyphosphoribosylaminopyrimidine deaminase / 5-amino-6-(5-phosphoribosylamino)uracil reductase